MIGGSGGLAVRISASAFRLKDMKMPMDVQVRVLAHRGTLRASLKILCRFLAGELRHEKETSGLWTLVLLRLSSQCA